ncbi:hypothetical protein MFIFM68171_05893 [Madurella fahalii]|uniref:Uncharacterized protein n=1 Tax=Madurella fahalii TaxID=1157608 RepID=A0ABQ0GD65_9PEZI
MINERVSNLQKAADTKADQVTLDGRIEELKDMINQKVQDISTEFRTHFDEYFKGAMEETGYYHYGTSLQVPEVTVDARKAVEYSANGYRQRSDYRAENHDK